MKIMAQENDPVMTEAIPSPREQLAIPVSTGKCKEAIGVNLTHEQVRRLDERRHETPQKVRDLRWWQDHRNPD